VGAMKTRAKAAKELASGRVACFHGKEESRGDFSECCIREFDRIFPLDKCLWMLLGDHLKAAHLAAIRSSIHIMRRCDIVPVLECLPKALEYRKRVWAHTSWFFTPGTLAVFETEDEVQRFAPDPGPTPCMLDRGILARVDAIGATALRTRIHAVTREKSGWYTIDVADGADKWSLRASRSMFMRYLSELANCIVAKARVMPNTKPPVVFVGTKFGTERMTLASLGACTELEAVQEPRKGS